MHTIGAGIAWLALAVSPAMSLGQMAESPRPPGEEASLTGRGPDHPTDSSTPIIFSRVYMPLAMIADAPGTYLPVTQSRFKRLIAGAAAETPPMMTSRLTSARYVARFDGGELVDGLANLRIEQDSPGRLVVRLDDCGLPINAPRWLDRASANHGDAILGMTPNQQLVAITEGSGNLEFDWSLRGTRQAASTFAFLLKLPSCVDSTIELLVPDPLEVTSRQGIITQQVDSPQTNRWIIRCGSVSQIEFVIAPRQTVTNPSATSLYAESTTYRMALDGVGFQTRMELEVLQSPINGLTLQMPSEVAVKAATIDGLAVPLDVINDRQNSARQLSEIHLDRTIAAGNHVVTVDCLTHCPPGALWELPRIRPQGVVWRHGTTTIEVQRPSA